jgi:fructose-1-phosphate kinase PfkB-like protein
MTDPMKPGDKVLVYFDAHTGTPGTLRSVSEDGKLATVFFGPNWQTVLTETVAKAKPMSLFEKANKRINVKGYEMIDHAKTIVDEASKILNESDWNEFLAQVAEHLNKADDDRFVRTKNAK